MKTVDKVIIGAGLYGLYAALFCAKKKEKVVVLEYDDEPFLRATYINQARVHMGYHYPRSLSTAVKSAGYFQRFNEDYGFCVHSSFDQVYATSANFSWTNAQEFHMFCKNAGIRCEDIPTQKYFKNDVCDGSFLTQEYTYDSLLLKKYFISELMKYSNVSLVFNARIRDVTQNNNTYLILESKESYESPFILNATYASINQVLSILGFEPFKIKYELCEIILCEVSIELMNLGITVMDGPFFSIMPFGKTGLHSLTSVTFTPHTTSRDSLPTFDCQKSSKGYCSSLQLGNCNNCNVHPKTAWHYMSQLAKKYLKDELDFRYKESLFSVKPILKSSEIDDSRPTVIKYFSVNPTFVSVLSGKINTVYDLDEVLSNDK